MRLIDRIIFITFWFMAVIGSLACHSLAGLLDASEATDTRLRQLESRWRRMADECRRNAVPENGATLDQCADELHSAREGTPP